VNRAFSSDTKDQRAAYRSACGMRSYTGHGRWSGFRITGTSSLGDWVVDSAFLGIWTESCWADRRASILDFCYRFTSDYIDRNGFAGTDVGCLIERWGCCSDAEEIWTLNIAKTFV
jgi:uncharacterized protein (DUF2235 family)